MLQSEHKKTELTKESKPELGLETEGHILKVAFLFEGTMVLIFFIVSYFKPELLKLSLPNKTNLYLAILSAFFLFFFNLIFVFISYRYKILSSIKFIEGIIEPLSRALSVKGALIVSILAGLGEELFFRGLLLPYLGLIISSILFSLAHFLVEVKKYIFLSTIYALIGLLFGVLLDYTGTLLVPIIFHSLYDFLAILFFRSSIKGRFISYAKQ